jgi:hypothetical protein
VRRRPGIAAGTLLVCVLALAAAVLLSERQKPTDHTPSPEEAQEKALAEIKRDLAARKPRVLIGETGPPEYSRFRTVRHRPPFGPPGASPFFLEAYGDFYVLLELVPDPQQEAFRFTAQVSFRTTNEGEAGLYFLGEERLTKQGPAQVFMAITFADQGSLAAKARLRTWFYREPTPTNPPRRLESPNPSIPDLALDRKIWHSLAVEVRPQSIGISCDGKAFPKLRLAEEKQRLAPWWTATLHTPPPSLAPRNSLGVFVRRGPAKFKNVIITPLVEELSR